MNLTAIRRTGEIEALAEALHQRFLQASNVLGSADTEFKHERREAGLQSFAKAENLLAEARQIETELNKLRITPLT